LILLLRNKWLALLPKSFKYGNIGLKSLRDLSMVMQTPADSTRNYSEELEAVVKMRN
jgi:hypothetical protein